ncbi:FGGY-family carbohydrate kinase [Klenkia terrae]|uniref:FGGY-family carbohydrate kinase n=1 Tax=Klenkia terrae TaxID=1052259 RepID=UPI0036235EC0
MRTRSGSISTVAYQLAGEPVHYALEGSVAVAGALVQWLRDGLGLIGTAPEIETLARTVEDNGGCYVVPAFSGLLAPHWRGEARGLVAGLTGYVTKGHLARAVLEAIGWQTRDVVAAMAADSGLALPALRVDGGMTTNNLLMQFVADVLNTPSSGRWSGRRCPRRGLRGRAGGRAVGRCGRVAPQLAPLGTVVPGAGPGGPADRGVPHLGEGRPAVDRLGRELSRPTLSYGSRRRPPHPVLPWASSVRDAPRLPGRTEPRSAPCPPSPRWVPRRGPQPGPPWPPRSSRSWSSAVVSPAPASRWTPPPVA